MKQTAAVRPREESNASLLWCVMGLLIPRATLLGALSPFGIALAACGGAANLPTLLCVGVGYLLATPVLLPLRYLAAVGLVAGGRWILDALPDGGRQPFVPPLLSFVACAASGMMGLVGGSVDGYRTLLILAEAAVAAGASLLFDTAIRLSHRTRPVLTISGQAAIVTVAAVAVSAAATIEVGGFSPGRVIAALLVLVSARSGRETGGCVAGCVLGGALALTAPATTYLAIALAFGGLIAGVFSRLGRVVEGGTFLMAALLIALAETDVGILMLLYELFSAVVLFVLLPILWERRLTRLLLRQRDLPAAEGVRRMVAMRLQVACGAIDEVAQSVQAVSHRLSRHGAADMAALYRGCATAVCAACPMRGVCWELKREEMLAGLETLTPRLQQDGRITAEQLKELPISCRRPEALADHLNQGYIAYIAREEAWNRLRDIQQAVEHQLSSTSDLLTGLAQRLQDPHGVDVELSDRVYRVCEDYGMAVKEALCTRDERGRLTIHILTNEGDVPEGKWHQRLVQACGCDLTTPTTTAWKDSTRITITEPPRYTIEQGIAQHICGGETLCGDTVQTAALCGGMLTVISDGMGCGGRAAVDSAMAAGITTRLWQADFSPNAILQTVNASLLVKSREETLATIDAVMIDTHSGRLDLYKAGATATLLRSGKRVSRLENTGLPVGILPQVQFAHSRDTLSEGDILLMISDGALSGGMAAVEEILAAHPDDGSMQALAQAVVDAAIAAAGDHPDDITAVAMRLCLPEED
ncbi:MAG: SpoIIE family protein phosphatase [Clostridia bacterium]|nr:SpoIIE family protein phosphatase [Clostridia bacterium]